MTSRDYFTACLFAIASIFSLEAQEKKRTVEFTCGDFFALSDGSVWELEQEFELSKGDEFIVRGNYRKEWQRRIKSDKAEMRSYEMFKHKHQAPLFTTKLIGITDLIGKRISSICFPEYDLTMLELFTNSESEEMTYLIELDDGKMFSSLSPEEGDSKEWKASDQLLYVRFDLKTYFLLNVERQSGIVALLLGTVDKEKKQAYVTSSTEWDFRFGSLDRWKRLSELPSFHWQLGDQVTMTFFNRVYSTTRPGDLIHVHNQERYALILNHVLNEVVIVKEDLDRLPAAPHPTE